MARPRTSAAILEMKGAFKEHPNRAREDAKVNKPIGEPPKSLTPAQLKIWKEIVPKIPAGIAGDADESIVEMVVILFAEFRSNSAEFTAAKYGTLHRLLSDLGMTPQGRAKIGAAPKPKSSNPFDDL
jgi:phage terminase small subunit